MYFSCVKFQILTPQSFIVIFVLKIFILRFVVLTVFFFFSFTNPHQWKPSVLTPFCQSLTHPSSLFSDYKK